MPDFYVIVPAAGESKRFKEKGIKLPKPLIRFRWGKHHKRTMLEHAVHGLEGLPIHVGVSAYVVKDFKHFIDSDRFIWDPLEHSTGQASTVARVASNLPLNAPLLVINSDSMFLYPLKSFIAQVKDFNAGAIVFDGRFNPSYSYVDNYPLFESATEKDPISPWAMAGAFYFRSRDDFLTAYEANWKARELAGNYTEDYISEIFRHIPGKKLAVYTPKEQWIVWGTAEELMADENVGSLEF